jgi:hypothetical protein
MKKGYFEEKQEVNKSIILELAKAAWRGLVVISTISIQKNMSGGGYRLVMFFNRKDK